ncbi:unnamed protein product [Meganyctiphanes norvegica]|uniref:Uncharacterized protein n=1 Tax=Meganyctiphanes norvegica TaxID=48144 RepID=A0AAV2RUH5_MEGNR
MAPPLAQREVIDCPVSAFWNKQLPESRPHTTTSRRSPPPSTKTLKQNCDEHANLEIKEWGGRTNFRSHKRRDETTQLLTYPGLQIRFQRRSPERTTILCYHDKVCS